MAHQPRTPAPLTLAQRRQHAAFLKHLARTGNARQAAAAIGVSDATLHCRRKRHPEFATRWDAALAAADARLNGKGGARPATGKRQARRAAEGEITVSVLKSGRLQVRLARADAVTRADEQRFLLALSATANVKLAAAAAGASAAAFNKRRRANPAFAREMQAALEQGYQRLEAALLESWSPASGDDAEWRDNEPPALPPMTCTQAIQLMAMHRKRVMWRAADLNRFVTTGQARPLASARLSRLYRARLADETEIEIAARALRAAVREEEEAQQAAPPIVLPDLGQVTGWSKADPAKTAANAGRVLGPPRPGG